MILNDFKIHSIDEVLSVGAKVIPDRFQKRFDEIEEYNILYENDREKIYQHYLNEMYKYGIFKKTNYNPLMLTPNYCSKSTAALIKYCMSENPIYSYTDGSDEQNNFLNKYVDMFEFNEKIKQIIAKIDVTGNCWTRIIPSLKDKRFYDLQILNSNQVFIVTDIMTDEVLAYIVFTIYKDNKDNYFGKYLVSEYKKNSYYDVKISNGIITDVKFDKEENLDYDDFSVHNFVVNREYNNYNYGVSSYRDVVPLQSNYIVGVNMIMSIVSRYSSPTMYGPAIATGDAAQQEVVFNSELPNVPVPNVVINSGLAVNPKLNSDKNEDVVSLAGKYLNIPDNEAIKPGYVTWDGRLEQQMEFYRQMKNDIGNFLGFPEVVKDDAEWTANIVSGKALKLKCMASIEKATLYVNSIKTKLEHILSVLTNTYKNEIVINFQDGLVDFADEQVLYATERINNGTMSIADAIAFLDKTNFEDALNKAKEIKSLEYLLKDKEVNYEQNMNNEENQEKSNNNEEDVENE